MNFLTESRIDYLTHRWNIHSGCNNWENGLCQLGEHCWAKQEVEANPQRYPFEFEPHFWPEALNAALSLKKPARVGVAFQGDLFCNWSLPHTNINYKLKTQSGKMINLRSSVRDATFSVCNALPQAAFLFLTKNWANLNRWEPFPDNAWVGGTATNQKFLHSLALSLPFIRCVHRWISLEPVYERLHLSTSELLKIDWIVIGAQTKPNVKVPAEYIEYLINSCIEMSVPVFLKKNLRNSIPHREPFYYDGHLRQDLPSGLLLPEETEKKGGNKS